jgi:hypothetical protein
MRGVPRTGGAGNTNRFWYVGRYPIPNPPESDQEDARYYGDDLAEKTLPELRVELRHVEAAWAKHGKRLDPTDQRRRWLEWRLLAVSESLMREEAALCREGRRSG